jgi:hypothetical protein
MHAANDTTPRIREISAMERGYRAIDWVTSRMGERAGMTPDQRAARAAYYDDRAASYVSLAKDHPAMLEFAGLNNLAANIMRAERTGAGGL